MSEFADGEIKARARDLRKSMTNVEWKLWNELRANRLAGFRFRRQHPIGDFIADFYCHVAKLVVEVDGPDHADRKERDAERDAWMRKRGLTVLRFTMDQVNHTIEAVCERIVAELNRIVGLGPQAAGSDA
jgi:very-short-patch-repair endonuclease